MPLGFSEPGYWSNNALCACSVHFIVLFFLAWGILRIYQWRSTFADFDICLQSSMVSPFALHQQQLALLSQQQALLAAAAKSGGVPQAFSMHANGIGGNHVPNGSMPIQSWPNLSYQMSGMQSVPGQNGANNFNQVML